MSLEKRVAALEQELADLRAAMTNGRATNEWKSTIGMFSGDEEMQQFFEQGMKVREADRKRTRNARRKARKVRA
jgi:hypothetical protein